jgi:hypothetical protein
VNQNAIGIMMAKDDGMKFLIWYTEAGSTAVRAGIEYSQAKKPIAHAAEMTIGAMNDGDFQPSIGPWVRARMRQMRKPIMRTTPGRSRRFHLGERSLEGGALMRGRRKKPMAQKMKQMIAMILKNLH